MFNMNLNGSIVKWISEDEAIVSSAPPGICYKLSLPHTVMDDGSRKLINQANIIKFDANTNGEITSLVVVTYALRGL